MDHPPSSKPASLVLVVEDEPQIAATLETYLRRDQFRTERASDGRQAISLYRTLKPDLVLLDIAIPEPDGLEVLKVIRSNASTPVIMITARTEEVDRLLGLALGADDYIVKPFSFREVVARVKTVLRRTTPTTETRHSLLRVGPLSLDTEKVITTVSGKPLHLTRTEYRLLVSLASAPGRVFSRTELLEACLPESDALERTVDSHLRNLRKKITDTGVPDLLETVRGMGYRLKEPL